MIKDGRNNQDFNCKGEKSALCWNACEFKRPIFKIAALQKTCDIAKFAAQIRMFVMCSIKTQERNSIFKIKLKTSYDFGSLWGNGNYGPKLWVVCNK